LMVSRMKILEGIAKGEKAILDGRVMTHDKAKEKLKKWLK
jgi:predicted transcriptional regulator